ncbi:maleylpyruvate isomerase family mycothiol-dependent enzyme [Mycobacterium spongiae]|uniref:Maleylpyruvate isomerase family mycothiol-dependent enzyme n=1 Tax=Mycobacterium spongiae TaxID=886343 RepID=A0A975JVV8_9MYCO|nr:maleylpyruvate isomerase family mycothiol-dependent enzyme [Mycobacterium spongiae]QUR66079.1 maleylpyruvate isomerase family mycothiol-dependent enzyme [Mycobacterium spongiae]
MDHAALFVEHNRLFSEVIHNADESTPLPTCPDWTLGQLIRHVGRGDRWAAQIVGDRLEHFLDPRSVHDGKPPPDPDGTVAWLHDGAQRLLDAVNQAGGDTPVWTFLGTRPAKWWVRRRLHEVAVHRADAAIALKRDFALQPETAADGISEWLERLAIQAGSGDAAAPLDGDTTMHLHCTDPGLDKAGEWTIRRCGTGIAWSHEHGKGTLALRGGATDLLLAMVRRVRVTDTAIQMFGDDGVWEKWLERTPL